MSTRPRARHRTTPRLAVAPTVELVPIESLTPLAENPRQHGPRDLGYLEEVLQRVGAARSGVVDEQGVVLAGNGFREAAMQAGFRQAIIVDADGRTPVFVRRRGLTARQKDELIVADNQAAALSGWDLEVLQAYADRHPDVKRGWTEQEWAAVLAGDGPVEPKGGLTDPDDVPVPRATDIQAGDRFALGPHVILCGNSTHGADVARLLGDVVPFLMITDPPYGVDYDPAWRAEAGVNKNLKKLGKVANDDRADWTEAWRLFPGTVAYVWHAGLKASTVQASLEGAGFAMRAQITWAKDRLVLSRGDYHWQTEPCWYAVRQGRPSRRSSDRSQTTLWSIPARDDAGHGHGTQKPVECMARPMRNHDAPTVYDPFVGSGTTLIAAEQLGRQCFALELTPTYVQVAIDRWEAFTGLKAVKVGEAVRA